jgi:DNA modification methylase
MIEMWDEVFAGQNPAIGESLQEDDGWAAFRLMHEVLDGVWREVQRVLVDGGIACINIGDATRTIGGSFALYPNHARILTAFLDLGFTPLPAILWRKQTNAPNKFMGSGMLPPGAYVTLEHEYVLVLRKGDKRPFKSESAKTNRRRSSFFWEERNNWFSDVWFDLKGTTQSLFDKETRSRSGAFPFELPYRLISMFSVKGDTVLDPFLGLGTTLFASMATGRNSVGYEIDANLSPIIADQIGSVVPLANNRINERLSEHAAFVRNRHETKGTFGYRNDHYGFPVVTRQEIGLLLNSIASVEKSEETAFEVEYSEKAQPEHVENWEWFFSGNGSSAPKKKTRKGRAGEPVQLDLLNSLNQKS